MPIDLENFKSLCLYNYGKGYVLVPPYKHPFLGKNWFSEIDPYFDKQSDLEYGGWWKSNTLSFKNCWFFKKSYLDRLKELDVRFFIEPSYQIFLNQKANKNT